MPLSWNEIKSRALAFSREWADASSEAKPFWITFFEIFGISYKRVATYEHPVSAASQNGFDAIAAFTGATHTDIYNPLALLPATTSKRPREVARMADENRTSAA